MKCIYHSSDLDGHCSGALVRNKYPNCEMIPADYNNAEEIFSSLKIESPYETVFIVDFSFKKEYMLSLDERCWLVWIDHHKTAIAECRGIIFKGTQQIGVGACELTYKYLYPRREIPEYITLLSRYDVWDFDENGDDVVYFQYGMRMLNTDPSIDEGFNLWQYLFTKSPENLKHYTKGRDIYLPNLIDMPVLWSRDVIIKTGKTCFEFELHQNEEYIDACAFGVEFEGVKFLACNKALANSLLFKSVPEEDSLHDAVMTFSYRPSKEWIVSMYSKDPNIDVSEIAKKHGGGGHKGAAGFHVDDIYKVIGKP